MSDDIELEGERYFHATGGKYKNPYKIYSDEFNRFERGWTQALKKSRMEFGNHPSGGAEYPILANGESPNPRNSVKQQAEEYKSRKG